MAVFCVAHFSCCLLIYLFFISMRQLKTASKSSMTPQFGQLCQEFNFQIVCLLWFESEVNWCMCERKRWFNRVWTEKMSINLLKDRFFWNIKCQARNEKNTNKWLFSIWLAWKIRNKCNKTTQKVHYTKFTSIDVRDPTWYFTHWKSVFMLFQFAFLLKA